MKTKPLSIAQTLMIGFGLYLFLQTRKGSAKVSGYPLVESLILPSAVINGRRAKEATFSEMDLVFKEPRKSYFLEPITSSGKIHEFLTEVIGKKMEVQEIAIVIYLNKKNIVIGYNIHTVGGVDSTIMDLKLIFAGALKANASAIIVCHNHPSGTQVPSNADISITEKIKSVGKELNMPLLDHIIVTADPMRYYSFTDDGRL